MLLKGARFVTYAAALAATGVIMVLISTYTPIGRRVLFLSSGLPVMLAGLIAGRKGSASVYAVTGLILLLLVQPLKGLAYVLVAGGVPLALSILEFPLIAQALLTGLLSLGYLCLAVSLLGLPLAENYQRLSALLPWQGINPLIVGVILLAGASFLYPVCLKLLLTRIQKHWIFEQVFKP